MGDGYSLTPTYIEVRQKWESTSGVLNLRNNKIIAADASDTTPKAGDSTTSSKIDAWTVLFERTDSIVG